MNKSEALKKIVLQARAGELVFPANVQASLSIQEALDEPDCGIESAARLVMKDPLMATRVVAIANSVAYSRFGGTVTNTRTAISILGFSTLRSVVAAVVMKQLRQSVRSELLQKLMTQLWQHSCEVGAIAHLLARKLTSLDAETALFAGIVHEIGSFYLLSRADEFPALLDDSSTTPEDHLDESDEVIVGRAVLHKLLVPKRVISAIETVWYGMPVDDPETLGDTLLLANTLSSTGSPCEHYSQSQIEARQAALQKEFPQQISSLLEQHQGEIQSLISSLSI